MFKTAEWITWIGALVAGTITLVAAAYTQFETKDHAKETKTEMVQRLDRMEGKIDTLLERGRD